jgi:phage shock protein A
MQSSGKSPSLKRLNLEVQKQEAITVASRVLLQSESLEDSFEVLEKEEQVDRLLQDLKTRQPRIA